VEAFRIELKHLVLVTTRDIKTKRNEKKQKNHNKHNKVSEHLTDKGFDLLKTQ
jgi:hypothetical protein